MFEELEYKDGKNRTFYIGSYQTLEEAAMARASFVEPKGE